MCTPWEGLVIMNEARRVEDHVYWAEGRINALLAMGWVITHDNGATVVLQKTTSRIPGDFVIPSVLEVVVHRCYYTHRMG